MTHKWAHKWSRKWSFAVQDTTGVFEEHPTLAIGEEEDDDEHDGDVLPCPYSVPQTPPYTKRQRYDYVLGCF